MKVKGLITAAGRGSRFGAITQKTNKGLLVVHKKPLLIHITEKFREAKIEDIYIVTGYQAKQVRNTLTPYRIKPLFNPFYKISGILVSFWQARPYLDGCPFLFTTSDHYFNGDMIKRCLKGNDPVTVIVQKKDRYTKEDAKVLLRGNRVVTMSKDLSPEKAEGEFGGMVFFNKKGSRLFFRLLENTLAEGGFHGYVMDILNAMHKDHGIHITAMACGKDSRIEIDSVNDLVEARKMARRRLKRGHKGGTDELQI